MPEEGMKTEQFDMGQVVSMRNHLAQLVAQNVQREHYGLVATAMLLFQFESVNGDVEELKKNVDSMKPLYDELRMIELANKQKPGNA